MNIITRFVYKIKHYITSHIEEFGISCIIILVSLSSYYLGRYSVQGEHSNNHPVYIETSQEYQKTDSPKPIDTKINQDNNIQSNIDGQVVASKNGKRYYYPWCASAQRISDKNKIYFANASEALRAGLTPANNCKGM